MAERTRAYGLLTAVATAAATLASAAETPEYERVDPFVVTTAADTVDAYDGVVSFREAVNYLSDENITGYAKTNIAFAVEEPVRIASPLAVEAGGTLAIDGRGARLVFSGAGQLRLSGEIRLHHFDISAPESEVEDGAVKVTGDRWSYIQDCRFHDCLSGAVRNESYVCQIDRCTFDHNITSRNCSSGVTTCGSIGMSVLQACTFTGNRFDGPAGSAGIALVGGISYTCHSCTFTGNRATALAGADDFYNSLDSEGYIFLNNCVSTGECDPVGMWGLFDSNTIGAWPEEVFETGEAITNVVEGVLRIGYLPNWFTTARDGFVLMGWPERDVFCNPMPQEIFPRGSCAYPFETNLPVAGEIDLASSDDFVYVWITNVVPNRRYSLEFKAAWEDEWWLMTADAYWLTADEEGSLPGPLIAPKFAVQGFYRPVVR